MFSFPRAVVTRYHKLGGLEQWRFVLSKFRSPEDWNQCPVVDRKVSAGTSCSLQRLWGAAFSWPSAASGDSSIPWLRPYHSHVFLCVKSPSAFLLQIYIWLHLQLTQIIQDNQFISRSLITYANVIFALSSNILRFQGLGCACLRKHHFSLPHLSPLRV